MSVVEEHPETEAEGLYELGLYAKKFVAGRPEFCEMFEDIDEEEIRMAIHWRTCTSWGVIFDAIIEDWSIEKIRDFIKEEMKNA